MSFSQQQKQQIITEVYKNSCCRRALLSGVITSKSLVTAENEISFSLEKNEYIEFLGRTISEFYASVLKNVSSKNGGRGKKVVFCSKAAVKHINSVSGSNQLFVNKCPACASSYLKGVFLACGTLSDPKKQYSMEFSPIINAEYIYDFLLENGFSPKIADRKEKKVIYFKRATDIEDLCGFIGLTGAMFEIANMQIERDILNNTNRVVNCETNNITKSVSASAKQTAAIKALYDHNLLSSLPDELEYTARLRLQNESLSLSQLSKLFTPPISKSGLSHRLTKIIEFSEILLKEKI